MVIKIYKKKRIISATGTPFSSEFVSAHKKETQMNQAAAAAPRSSSSTTWWYRVTCPHHPHVVSFATAAAACHYGNCPRAPLPTQSANMSTGQPVATAARLKGLGVIKFKSVPCECAEQHRFSSSAGELISGFISSSLLHAAKTAAACPPKEGVGINGMPWINYYILLVSTLNPVLVRAGGVQLVIIRGIKWEVSRGTRKVWLVVALLVGALRGYNNNGDGDV